jgi:glutamyl-Q tRNA(Asp) synthetase
MNSTAPARATRFAPSPTGLLHLGSAYSALDASSASEGGRFLIRIEDIDQGRCKKEFEDAIYEDLTWLGLTWETPVRRQSEHFDDYQSALDALERFGFLYPCFCTRAEIQREIENASAAPHDQAVGPDGPIYPGTCRHLPEAELKHRVLNNEPYALRLRTDAASASAGPLTWKDEKRGEIIATPEIFGDVVLARKDTPASYHIACTWDDALQGITHVTRGEDLFSSTHIHRLLQALLDLPTPCYRHHALISGPGGKKFSKRDSSMTIRTFREKGWPKERVIEEMRRLTA